MMQTLIGTLLALQVLTWKASAFAPLRGVLTDAIRQSPQTAVSMAADHEMARRTAFTNVCSFASSVVFLPGAAFASDKYQTYKNDVCGYQISVPATWEKNTQQLPDRRQITLFIDPTSGADGKTLFFEALTPVRDDFTSLGSFGSVDQVAQAVILPRGELQGEETKSQMLSAKSERNAYIFDYKVSPPNLPETHYRAIFSLAQGATGGAGSVLVTLTIQTPESRYAEMKPVFDEVIGSYTRYQA